MKTLKEWQTGEHGSFTQYCQPFDQVDEDIYWYFLEILPPIFKSGGFMVSEPYGYDEQVKQNTYMSFCTIDGGFYYLGVVAPKNFEQIKGALK